jgi:hypothetical protein
MNRSGAVGSFVRRGIASAACMAALVGAALPARAEGDDRPVAEALFNKGRDALKRGDLDAACAAFEESTRLEPAPGTMFNLGDCEEKRGHIAVAWQWFEEATQKLPASDKRRPLVVARAAALKARVPEVTIRLGPGAPADTTVVRDSIALGQASIGVALPTEPGTHRIVVSAPGHEDRGYPLEVKEREKRELVVEPGAALPAPPAPVPPPVVAAPQPVPPQPPPKIEPTSSRGGGLDKRTTGFIVGGIGVAGIGTALVLGAVALGDKSTVDEHCNKSTHLCNSPDGIDAASSGATLSTVSTVTFIVGAAALGVGAYLVLTSDGSPKTAVGASATAGGTMLRVVRQF